MAESSGRRIAIHQANYLPYCGYFYKMAQVDTFVLLDSVQFPRGRSYAARNRIKTAQGSLYLTIPCSIATGFEGKVTYGDVAFASQNWQDKHKRTLRLNYARAEFFSEVFQIYTDRLPASKNLLDLNIRLIRAFADYLGLSTELLLLSDLLPVFGRKTQLIVDICRRLDASVYVSGTGGGMEYTEEALLKREGIDLVFSDFSPRPYRQLWGEFIANLSVIDLLFNAGPRSGAQLRAMRREERR